MGLPDVSRRLWALFEPVHAVIYFAPQAHAAFEAAGLRGFWRGYFANRAAPLGEVGPGPVIASFFSFAPSMVTRALPAVWSLITAEGALAARRDAARAALTPVLSDVDGAEVAGLLRAAAESADHAGRVLGAANAALPWPEDPLDVLWHATTILREHRGDGHIAALVTEELGGPEVTAWRTALSGFGRDLLQPARGWTDEEWAAGVDALRTRGWLDAEGGATPAAHEAYERIEGATNRLAYGPWRALGEERTERCAQLLHPLAVRAAPLLRYPNPIGLPDPRQDP